MTNSISSRTTTSPEATARSRGCLFCVKRGLKWFGIILIVLVVLGVTYQTIATELDKRNFSPRGQFYVVNGHKMHMVCMGEGGPVVILQAGLSAESLWWYRVQSQLAQHTRVCAYDRPGLGWSEPVSGSRDALTIVAELHSLLEQAGIAAPYMMAGHSYGAIWTRIYTAHYPKEVAGIVLVDSGLVTPQQFITQSEFDQWKISTDALQLLVWGIYRTGLMRLNGGGEFKASGYPSEIVPEMVALHSSNRVFDTSYAESVPALLALTQASAAAENLGNLPVAILWASETDAMMERIPALSQLHDEISTYSSNSVTHIVEGADHGSILGNERYAQQVSNAILDVLGEVKSGEPIER